MKLIKYLFVALVLGTFSSCSDYLDKQPDDMLTLEMVFNDKTRTEVSLEEYYTFTTEETEKLELFKLAERLDGDLELAIKQLAESKRNPN